MRREKSRLDYLKSNEVLVLIIYTLSVGVVLMASWLWGNDLSRSDGGMYLSWSGSLLGEPNEYLVRAWVPGYSMVLWFLRVATFGSLSGGAALFLTNYVCGLGSLFVVSRVLNIVAPRVLVLGVAVFGFFPFVGYDYTFVPRADKMAILLFLLAILSFLEEKWLKFSVFVGLGLIVQKALWPFLFVLFLFAMYRAKDKRLFLWMAPLPLLGYWLYGMGVGLEPLFPFGFVPVQVAESSSWPFAKGIGAALSQWENPGKLIKGGFIVCLTGVAWLSCWRSLRGIHMAGSQIAFAIGLPLAVAPLLLNDSELWAVARYGVLLCIPGAMYAGKYLGCIGDREARWAIFLLGLIGLLSHLLFLRFVKLPLMGI